MTTAAAPVTLTFDSEDIQDIDGICLHTIVRGAPGEAAEPRGRDDVALGRDGRVPRNRRRDHRIIELVGFVRGTGSDEAAQREDYWDNRVALEELFSGYTVETLSATFPGGAVYTIGCRATGTPLIKEVVPSFAEVSVELLSVDPDWEQVGT